MPGSLKTTTHLSHILCNKSSFSLCFSFYHTPITFPSEQTLLPPVGYLN